MHKPLDACFVDDDGVEVHGVVFVSLFASHLQRLALLIDVCRARGRKLVLLGRGLHEAYAMALAEGVVDGAGVVGDESDLKNLPRHRLCVALTGSQGEPRAALARLARRDPSQGIVVEAGDRVVFSARVIPGNEGVVQPLVDAFLDQGADVVAGRQAPHVSGHGYQEDLRLLVAACRPRTFVALHGNPENLHAHGDLVVEAGVDVDAIVGLRDGHTLVVDGAGRREHITGPRAHEPAAIDGDVCWFPGGIARARQRMHKAGVLIALVGGGEVRLAPQHLFPELGDGLREKLLAVLKDALATRGQIDDEAKKAVAKAFYKAQREPPEVIVVDV